MNNYGIWKIDYDFSKGDFVCIQVSMEDNTRDITNIDDNFKWFPNLELAHAMIEVIKETTEYKICMECGKLFIMDKKELNWYESRNLDIPCRCKSCRKMRKESMIKTDNFNKIINTSAYVQVDNREVHIIDDFVKSINSTVVSGVDKSHKVFVNIYGIEIQKETGTIPGPSGHGWTYAEACRDYLDKLQNYDFGYPVMNKHRIIFK